MKISTREDLKETMRQRHSQSSTSVTHCLLRSFHQPQKEGNEGSLNQAGLLWELNLDPLVCDRNHSATQTDQLILYKYSND